MRRTALALSLALVGSALAGQVTAAARPVQVDVIVVLKSQADVAGVHASTRAARLAGVERTLRDHAARTQRGLLDLLAHRTAAVRPLWIANAVEVTATPAVIRELAGRPDVAAVQPNSTIQAPSPATAT